MGTVVTVKAYMPDSGDALPAIDAAFKEMARIDSISGYEKGSETDRINSNPNRFVPVSADVAGMVRKTIHYSEISNGAFDITVGPLMILWHRFEGESLAVPSQSSIASALSLVDFRKISVDSTSVKLAIPGGSIDLGAIAKGYAVDRGTAVLESLGAAGGLVDAGGDIGTFGKRPDGRSWRIGLKDPRTPDSIAMVFEVADISVVTSGDYERYFMKDGVRYHHIVDPSTGFPARGCCSVTIIADKATDADALATTVFVLGPEKGMALVESLPNTECLIIVCEDGKRQILRSSGLAKYEANR
jgi:thiamine biosynthesis lipoprotein